MAFCSRLLITLKSLLQLGLEPLALNALYKFGLWTGHYRRVIDRRPQTMNHGPSSIVYRPLFSLPSRDQLLQTLGAEGKTALLREADEIVEGKVRLFGGEAVPLQLAFNEPLHHWTEYETGKTPIPYSLSSIHDIK